MGARGRRMARARAQGGRRTAGGGGRGAEDGRRRRARGGGGRRRVLERIRQAVTKKDASVGGVQHVLVTMFLLASTAPVWFLGMQIFCIYLVPKTSK